MEFLFKLINFLLLVIILYILLAKRSSEYFKNRSASLRRNREEKESRRIEATERIKDYSSRLNKIEVEISEIKELFHKEGEMEQERALEDAKKEVEALKEQARAYIQEELGKAITSLRGEAIDKSLSLVKKKIADSLVTQDHEKIFKEFIERIER